MNAEQFAYWLQGCSELNPGMEAPTPEQWKVIKDHLALVFRKVTPPFPLRELAPSHPMDYQTISRNIPPFGPMVVTC